MLKFYHTLIPLLLVAGCELLDNDIKMGPDRYQTEKSGIRGGSSGDGAGGETGTIPKDTLLYVSGIAFPQGYNWQRDTAFGTSGGRLQLFRNGISVFYTGLFQNDKALFHASLYLVQRISDAAYTIYFFHVSTVVVLCLLNNCM